MFETTDIPAHDNASPGDLVIHGQYATLFGAVGIPVPADACMGLAEAAAARERPEAVDRRTHVEAPASRTSRFRLAAAPGR
jgi:hypothetical protein